MRGEYGGSRVLVGEDPPTFSAPATAFVIGAVFLAGVVALRRKTPESRVDMSDIEQTLLARGMSREQIRKYGW